MCGPRCTTWPASCARLPPPRCCICRRQGLCLGAGVALNGCQHTEPLGPSHLCQALLGVGGLCATRSAGPASLAVATLAN
eukprot:6224308-Alexandrium_andersonii.AAC.1